MPPRAVGKRKPSRSNNNLALAVKKAGETYATYTVEDVHKHYTTIIIFTALP